MYIFTFKLTACLVARKKMFQLHVDLICCCLFLLFNTCLSQYQNTVERLDTRITNRELVMLKTWIMVKRQKMTKYSMKIVLFVRMVNENPDIKLSISNV